MSTTNVTLRINSYQTKNTVLFNGEAIPRNNKVQNCKARPITECAADFFKAVYDELNGSFAVHVHGNIFEYAVLATEAQTLPYVSSLTAEYVAFNWTTRARLQYLQELLGSAAETLSLPISLGGNISVRLPEYPLVSFSLDDRDPAIIVSNDIYQIEDLSEDRCCEPVAFLVGGESKKISAAPQYIIGCIEEDVQRLVCAYLESQYINPFIRKLIAKHRKKFRVESDPLAYLVDRNEPYYYVKQGRETLTLLLDTEATLAVHSLSLDARGKVKLDAKEDLSQLIMSYQPGPGDGLAAQIISHDANDFRQITAVQHGHCELCFFFRDDSSELFRIGVNVRPHTYITSISSKILYDGEPVKRWKKGQIYKISTEYQPSNAENIGSIVYQSSNPDVARIKNNTVTILDEGKFNLITIAGDVRHEQPYIVNQLYVQAIRLKEWPKRDETWRKNAFCTNVLVEPAPANWSGFSYEIKSGKNCVSIEHTGGSGIVVHPNRPGTAVIDFWSNDNPQVRCTKTLTVLKDPPKPKLFVFFGIAGMVLSGLCIGSADEWLFPVFFLTAVLSFFIAIRRREKDAIVACIVSSLLFVFLFVNFLPKKEKDDKPCFISNDSLSEMREYTESKILDMKYVEDSFLSEKIWTPIDYEYLGYFLNQDRDDYDGFIVYEVELVNPDAEAPLTMYLTITHEGERAKSAEFSNYNLKRTTAHWHRSIYEWFDRYTNNDNIIATSFSNDELYEMFGWNSYVDEINDLSSDDIAYLIECCVKQGDLTGQVAAVEGIYLECSLNIYSESRNTVYIILRKDSVDDDTAQTRSYYLPFAVKNIKLITDDSGNQVIDRENIDIDECDFALSLKESLAAIPKNAVEIPFAYTGLSKYVYAETIPLEQIQRLAEAFMEQQVYENENEGSRAFTYSDVELIGIYLAQAKPDGRARNVNELHILLQFDRYYHGEFNFTISSALVFSDVMIDSEGNLSITYEDGEIESEYKTAEEYLEELANEYTVYQVA